MTNDKNQVGMFISDMPLNVFKRFKLPCEANCGDTYWVRLKELLDKEDLYDQLLTKLKIEGDRK